MRGLGKRITSCENGEDLIGNRCYSPCTEGFSGHGQSCFRDCPTNGGKVSDGSVPFCARPKNEGRMGSPTPVPGYEKIGLTYFSPCKPNYTSTATQCIGQCPEGTTDAGWMGCKKQTYQRPYHPAMCYPDQEQSRTGLTCYEKCPNGSNGVGPFCFGSCPANTKSCFGILCLSKHQKCSDVWSSVASNVQ